MNHDNSRDPVVAGGQGGRLQPSGETMRAQLQSVAIAICEYIANERVTFIAMGGKFRPGCNLAPMIRSSKKEKSNA